MGAKEASQGPEKEGPQEYTLESKAETKNKAY